MPMKLSELQDKVTFSPDLTTELAGLREKVCLIDLEEKEAV
jgi:hypothetical protein